MGQSEEEVRQEDLDPGIRDLVRQLNDAGFKTTDSGDGVSKPADWYLPDEHGITQALPFPHVVVAATVDDFCFVADRLAAVLGPAWQIEATYFPHDQRASVLASKMTSERP